MKVKIVLGSLIIVSLFSFSIWTLNKGGFFNLTATDVMVENFKDQKSYLSPLIKQVNQNMMAYMGQSLWSLRLEKVEQSLETLPWVESVHVSVRWPVSLRIEIVAKPIPLLLAHHNGELLPITREGDLLPAIPASSAPSVPLVQGEIFEQQKLQRKKAVEIVQAIPESGNFSQSSISEIHYDSQSGFWIQLMSSGMRVNLGDDEVLKKSLRVSQVLNYVDEHQLDARVIDANLSKKVLVRLRKGP